MMPYPTATKPHYPVLDGLRGVAALAVVTMHICEAHSTSALDMLMNHGYLAVDFFFLLPGFVIGCNTANKEMALLTILRRLCPASESSFYDKLIVSEFHSTCLQTPIPINRHSLAIP